MKCAICGHESLPAVHLTERQIEILVLSCKGFDMYEIADRLGITYHTVNDLRKRSYKALGVGSIGEAAVLAVRMGLPV